MQGASFQDCMDWKQWKDELDGLGFLNVCLGVNLVHVGVALLSPNKTTYCDALTTSTGTKKIPPTSDSRAMLDWWKLYLDSCVTYHTVFVDWHLDNVHEVDIFLKSNCNAGVTISNQKGWFGALEVWLNK